MTRNLLGPEPTLLPERTQAQAALDAATDPEALTAVAAAYPDFSAGWAALAEQSLAAGEPVAAYAFARTGYHRGLDQLRRAGWKGFGPVPFDHRPNQGFLRALAALATAAQQIGETEEYDRCRQFVEDSDPKAAGTLGLV
ncbi:MAG TPA: DUF3151 domain-containing protein [Pseudonocardiaceae bacterium]|jgi:hypothetical protein|nr:DUF3151 domain-containing protein [Pseudonocardiaceae bacterium]